LPDVRANLLESQLSPNTAAQQSSSQRRIGLIVYDREGGRNQLAKLEFVSVPLIGGDNMAHHYSHTVEDLRRESERSRAELRRTIDELGKTLSETTEEIKTKVSPDYLRREARSYAREKSASIVRDLKESAQSNPLQALAIGAGLAYPLLGLVKNIPVPLALIGAGIILSRNRGTSPSARPADQSRYVGGNGSGDGNGRISAAVEEGKPGDTLTGKAAEAISSGARTAIESTGAAAQQISARATKVAEESRNAFAGMIDSNPLLIGGIAMAIGGFVAASLPVSRIEEDALATGRETLKGTVRKAAAGVVSGAKAQAAEIAENVSAAARERGLSPEALDEAVDTLSEKVASVADRAIDAALAPEPLEQNTEDRSDGDQNARI
jgi:hypothetical protein